MKPRVRNVFVVLTIGLSLFFAVRVAKEWAAPPSPFEGFLDELDARIPFDARILLVTRHSEWRLHHPCLANSRLYPRVVYTLPPGVETVEAASAWIAEKRLTWAVSIGGPSYDPERAFARKLE
jgi:hypothetical protein